MPKDRETITAFTFAAAYRDCTFSFANMCSYSHFYNTEFAIVDGMLLLRYWIKNKKVPIYTIPLGDGDLAVSLSLLEVNANAYGHPLMLSVSTDAKERIDAVWKGQYICRLERDYFDYVYKRTSLATLTGNKLQSKRNHINRFKRKYDYRYLPLSTDLVHKCLELGDKWVAAKQDEKTTTEFDAEQIALPFALQHFDELALQGGVIFVGDDLVAFCIGNPITSDTFGILFEKADVNYDGSFALINQEFAKHLQEQYTYINREEDMGIPGLRKAKLSYKPAFMVEKCTLIKNSSTYV